MEQGHYPREFLGKVVAWYKGHVAIEGHTQAEIAKAAKKKK